MLFATLLLLYGILRDQIMTSTAGSVFLGAVWTYLGTISTLLVELAVIIKYVYIWPFFFCVHNDFPLCWKKSNDDSDKLKDFFSSSSPKFEKNAAFGTNSSSGGQQPSGEKSTSANQYTSQDHGYQSQTTYYSSQQQEQQSRSYDDDNGGNDSTNAYYMKTMESVIADQQMEYQQVIQKHTINGVSNGDRVKKYNVADEGKPATINSSPILDEYEISAFYNSSNESQGNHHVCLLFFSYGWLNIIFAFF